MRYKSGQRFIGNKTIIDKESVQPMPSKSKTIKFICGEITVLYFLCLGLPAAYQLNKHFREQNNVRKTETKQRNNFTVGDSIQAIYK